MASYPRLRVGRLQTIKEDSIMTDTHTFYTDLLLDGELIRFRFGDHHARALEYIEQHDAIIEEITLDVVEHSLNEDLK